MQFTNEAKVGSVTLIGLILLAYMIIHLGGFHFGESGYPVQATFSQVGGLKEGNVIRYAGVDIGRVERIKVNGTEVEVTLKIQPGFKIPSGSKITISSEGLMGEKFISILPPTAITGYWQPNEQVRGQDMQGFEQLMATADKVMLDVQKLVQSMNEVLGDEKVKAAMKESILNTREITANLNAMSAVLAGMAQDNAEDVKQMVNNLSVMSGSLRDVAARVDKLVDGIDNNGQTTRDLTEMLSNLKSTSSRVEKMAAALEGVVTDPATAQNIKVTLQNAREASEKANKVLSKYQNVKVQAGMDGMYSNDTGKYRGNVDVRIQTSPQDFAVIGASGIGENTAANLQVGKGNEQFAGRMGIVDSKMGVGVDAGLGKQLRLSLDAYDPNDVRVKLRGQLQVAPDTYVVSETDNINKSADKTTYIGVRRTF